jgi:uncharacterized CHY-type Zn-finger protein
MTNMDLPPGFDGLLGNAKKGPDQKDGQRCCARCGKTKDLTAFPDVGAKHLCYECTGGNTQAISMPQIPAVNGVAVCPVCKAELEVTPDVYGKMAKCPACETVFVIIAPE